MRCRLLSNYLLITLCALSSRSLLLRLQAPAGTTPPLTSPAALALPPSRLHGTTVVSCVAAMSRPRSRPARGLRAAHSLFPCAAFVRLVQHRRRRTSQRSLCRRYKCTSSPGGAPKMCSVNVTDHYLHTFHSRLNKMTHSKISTPIDRAAAARSKSVEFSKCVFLVDSLRRCEDNDPSH